MPDVKQIAHDHADKLIVLGITVTDKEEAVQRFLKDRLFRTRSYTALPGRAICYRRTVFRMLMALSCTGLRAHPSRRRSRLCAGWCKRKTSIPERGNQRSPPASTLATRERQAEIPVWLLGSQRVTGCT